MPSAMRALAALCATVALPAVAQKSENIKMHEGISREEKWKNIGHKGITLWMTGLSGSGKSTVSVALENALVTHQPKSYFVYRLDGDNLRYGLNRDLGFAPEDRKENVRRVSEVAKLFAEAGAIVIAGLISPYKADRDYAREVHKNASLPFLEVFIDAPLSVVQQRDPKGLYKKVAEGKIKGFTGVDAPYEAPDAPEIHIQTAQTSIKEAANIIMRKLDEVGINLPRSFRELTTEEEDEAVCASKK
jgi:adenylylsulfate kinase